MLDASRYVYLSYVSIFVFMEGLSQLGDTLWESACGRDISGWQTTGSVRLKT